MEIPRVVSDQMQQGTPVASLGEAKPGDLLVSFGGNHISIYLGNGKAIDAPVPGKTIQIRDAWEQQSNLSLDPPDRPGWRCREGRRFDGPGVCACRGADARARRLGQGSRSRAEGGSSDADAFAFVPSDAVATGAAPTPDAPSGLVPSVPNAPSGVVLLNSTLPQVWLLPRRSLRCGACRTQRSLRFGGPSYPTLPQVWCLSYPTLPRGLVPVVPNAPSGLAPAVPNAPSGLAATPPLNAPSGLAATTPNAPSGVAPFVPVTPVNPASATRPGDAAAMTAASQGSGPATAPTDAPTGDVLASASDSTANAIAALGWLNPGTPEVWLWIIIPPPLLERTSCNRRRGPARC